MGEGNVNRKGTVGRKTWGAAGVGAKGGPKRDRESLCAADLFNAGVHRGQVLGLLQLKLHSFVSCS